MAGPFPPFTSARFPLQTRDYENSQTEVVASGDSSRCGWTGIGRAQPDLVLVGFSVDTPAAAPSASTSTPPPGTTVAGPSHLSAPSTSAPQQQQQQQQRQASPLPPPIPAPPAASSSFHHPPPSTNAGAARPVQHRPSDPVAPDNSYTASVSRQAQRAPSTTTTTQTQHGPGGGGGGSGSSRPTSVSAAAAKDPVPFEQQQRPPSPRHHRPSPAAAAAVPADSAKQTASSSVPPLHSGASLPPSVSAAAKSLSSSSTGGLSRFQQLQQASRDRRPSGIAPDEGGDAKQVASTSTTDSKNGIGIGIDMSGGRLTAAAAAGGGSGSRTFSPVTTPPPAITTTTTTTNGASAAAAARADEVLDNETILANVEEMLEGFEWRGGDGAGGGAVMGSRGGGASGGGGGGRKGRSKADEMERRLISELKALEAVRYLSSSDFPSLSPPLSLHMPPRSRLFSHSSTRLRLSVSRDTPSISAVSCHCPAREQTTRVLTQGNGTIPRAGFHPCHYGIGRPRRRRRQTGRRCPRRTRQDGPHDRLVQDSAQCAHHSSFLFFFLFFARPFARAPLFMSGPGMLTAGGDGFGTLGVGCAAHERRYRAHRVSEPRSPSSDFEPPRSPRRDRQAHGMFSDHIVVRARALIRELTGVGRFAVDDSHPGRRHDGTHAGIARESTGHRTARASGGLTLQSLAEHARYRSILCLRICVAITS